MAVPPSAERAKSMSTRECERPVSLSLQVTSFLSFEPFVWNADVSLIGYQFLLMDCPLFDPRGQENLENG